MIEVLPPIHGIMAEFETGDELVDAVKRAREAGYRKMDAYSPLPMEELNDVMDLHDNRISLMVLIGGLLGGTGGYSLLYWTMKIAYPLNIGGRPLHVPISNIPITFECTILIAGLTAAIGMILLNGLPKPYHPVFNVSNFARASQDRFFLCIEAEDPLFDRTGTTMFLESLHPDEVAEVAH